MATLAVQSNQGNALLWSGGVGVNANDVVIQTGDSMRYDEHMLFSVAGAMQVLVSFDGTNYSTAPLSLMDQGATTTAPVIVTAAGRVYSFFGYFAKIKVTQNGATAVTGASLVQSKKGGAT